MQQITRCCAGVLCLGSSLPAIAPGAIGAIHQTALGYKSVYPSFREPLIADFLYYADLRELGAGGLLCPVLAWPPPDLLPISTIFMRAT